jgi:hypothetical protein
MPTAFNVLVVQTYYVPASRHDVIENIEEEFLA